MAAKRFPLDFSQRVGLKKEDIILVNNSDTGVDEVTTIEEVCSLEAELLLTGELGDSEVLAINQKKVTEVFSTKADKVIDATNGNLASLDENGNVEDSGTKPSDFVKVVDIANNLTTEDAGKVLDARQGKVLNDAKINKDGSNSDIDVLHFNPETIEALAVVGDVRYSSESKTLEVKISDTCTIQIGQEMTARVKNGETSDIPNGKVVYIDTALGANPVAKLATTADQDIAQRTFAVATEDIATFGIATTEGLVRDVNTDGMSEGSLIWLTTDGNFTTTEPTAPTPKVCIGMVLREHQNEGVIYVHIRAIPRMAKLSDVFTTTLTGGDVLRYNSTSGRFEQFNVDNALAGKKYYLGIESYTAFTFDNSTKVLTLPAVKYWYKGTAFTSTGAITCDLDLTADRDNSTNTLTTNTLYYLYFKDATGKLYWSDTMFNFDNDVILCTIYWNGSAGAVQVEAHSYTRDIEWHRWAHLTIGTRYLSGLLLTAPTTANDAAINIATGVIRDEDISFTTGQQQVMRGWRLATSTKYTWADYSLPYLGTLGAPAFNNASYALETFPANRFACYWVYASLDKDRPIYIIPTQGTAAYNTIALARAETPPVLANLPFNAEFKLIYRFIYSGDGQFQESADYRLSQPLPSGGIGTVTAGAVSFTPSGNISSTSVQSALEELDTEKVAVANIANNLTETTEGKVLDARQGKVLADADALKVDKSSITQDFGTDITKVISQNFFTNAVRNIEDLMWYGIEWDITVSDPACTRIGNPVLHAMLPIQSNIRRCLLLDTGVVNYYLDALDSTKKADGTNALLDGTDGQVMVETPAHYRKFEEEGNKVRCKLSILPLSGYHFVPRYYRSAYEATVERATNKLSSVVNNTAAYRGGNNNAAWDAETRTLLGRAATVISLTNFRAYARNRGASWNCDVYDGHKAWFWLYSVEYANFNSQLAYNASPTSAGYKQGGLGDGVTTLVGANWNNWNSYYPFLPCGYTNSLGNRTGLVAFAMPAEYGAALTVQVPSYRGLENPFGHMWKWMDGIKVKIQAVAAGDKSEFYVCSNPAQFQDTNYTNYLLRGLLPRANGYIKQMLIGEFGEIMPKVATGESSSTYFSDYFYTDIPASGESQRGVLFGGHGRTVSNAGLGCSNTSYTASSTLASIGSRLCYIS